VGIVEQIAAGLIRFSFSLERFFPRFAKFLLVRKLKEYKERGVIADYKVKAERKKKYHYSFEVDLFLELPRGGEKHV